MIQRYLPLYPDLVVQGRKSLTLGKSGRALRFVVIALVLVAALGILSLADQKSPANAAIQLYVTVQFDKPQYAPGETVTLAGRVTESSATGSPVGSALLSLEVDDSRGTMVFAASVLTDENGNYSALFGLGQGAEEGQYSASAVASKPGFTDGAASTHSQVIAEFPVLIVGIVLAALLFGLTLARKRSNS